MGELNLAGYFKGIEHGNPVFSGGFHADLRTVQLHKPTTKVSKTFEKSGKPGFMVIGSVVTVSNTNKRKSKSCERRDCNSYSE